MLEYYAAIAPVLLPHLRDRPFTIKQHYNGPRSPFRWLKDLPPGAPLATTAQPAKSRGGATVRYPLVRTVNDLLWLVDYGCIDLHVWPSRRDKPDRPDYVLFDLDPRGGDVVAAALLLREALGGIGLTSYPRTTGGDGLHVQVPVARRYTHAETRAFSRTVAAVVAPYAKGVSFDTKMNGHGQQIVSVYSLRPREHPAVSTPVTWDELELGLDPRAFTMASVLERVSHLGDLHAPVLRGTQRLPAT